MQCLCHQSGTVACICVLFGLQTLADTLSPAVPSSGLAGRSVGVSRDVPSVGNQPLPGHLAKPQRGPQDLRPPGAEPLGCTATPLACGAECGVGLCHPASTAALRASRPPVSSPSQIPPLE